MRPRRSLPELSYRLLRLTGSSSTQIRRSRGTFLAMADIDPSTGCSHGGEVAQGLDSGQKKISAASYRGKRRYPPYLFLDGPLGNRQIVRPILSTEDWITFISQLVEIWIVRPDVHGKLELTDEAGTAHEGCNSPFHSVVGYPL